MARISTYPLDDSIGLNDILFGSENNGIGSNGKPVYVTKNYRIGDLSNFFGLSGDNVSLNTTKLASLATFNTDGSVASLQNATVNLINTATTAAGFATSSSVTAVNSRVDIILGTNGSSVSEAFANQVFTTTTNSDFAAATDVTELKSQFTYSGSDINGLASGTTISTAIATAETSAVSTANAARAAAETALVATISKVFRQTSAPAVTEPVNSIWYDTDDNNKPYVLVAGTPRVWTTVNDPTLATSASVTTVSDAVATVNGHLSASHSLMVNAGGSIAGMKLSSTTNNSGVSTSDVVFLADQFAIKTSSGTKQPFTVSGDVVTIDGTLQIGGTAASTIKSNAASGASALQPGNAASDVNSNNTTISGGKIRTGEIESTGYSYTSGNFSTAGMQIDLDDGVIRSKNFGVDSSGSAFFKGDVTGASGTFSGDLSIGSSNSIFKATTSGIQLGHATFGSAPFRVTAAGALTATDATITGAITCTSISFNSGVTVPNASVAGLGSFATKSSLAYSEVTGLPTLGTLSGLNTIAATHIDDNAITTPKINAGAIDAGKIATNAITADKILANNIDASKISSLSFAGKSATFDTGTIGGFTLSSSDLHNGKTALTNTTAGIYVGTDGISLGGTGTPTFSVTAAGALTASNANITGVVTATSGSFTGTVNASAGSFTGAVTATSGSFTGTINASGGTFAGALSSASGDFTGEITADEGTIGGWVIGSDVLNSSNSDVKINSGSGSSGIEMLDTGGTLRVKVSPTGTITDPLVSGAVSVGDQAQENSETLTLNSTNFAGSFSNTSGNPTTINLRTSATAAGGTLFHNGKPAGNVGGATGATVGYTLVIPQNSGELNVAAVGTRTGWSISAIFGVRITDSATAGSGNVIADHSFSVTSSALGVSHSAQTFTGSFVAPSSDYRVHSYVKKIRIVGTLTTEVGSNTNVTSVTIKAPAVTVSATIAAELSELTSGGFLVSKGSDAFLRVDRSSNTRTSPFIKSKGFMEHQGRLTVLNASGDSGSGDIYLGGTDSNNSGYMRIFSNTNSHKYIEWGDGDGTVQLKLRYNGNEKFQFSSTGVFDANSTKNFKINHLLESKKETHYLRHAAIEGPQADLIYRGKVTLSNGTATVNIDEVSRMSDGTFSLLCRNIQCFTSNETGWDAVKASVSNNTLTINCQNTNSSDEISWMVIAERKDSNYIDSDVTDENGLYKTESEKED
tara:strand:+ start:306 stop:3926 length:3621 start_codon:yes stop_codon:yes gene_type:complete